MSCLSFIRGPVATIDFKKVRNTILESAITVNLHQKSKTKANNNKKIRL